MAWGGRGGWGGRGSGSGSGAPAQASRAQTAPAQQAGGGVQARSPFPTSGSLFSDSGGPRSELLQGPPTLGGAAPLLMSDPTGGAAAQPDGATPSWGSGLRAAVQQYRDTGQWPTDQAAGTGAAADPGTRPRWGGDRQGWDGDGQRWRRHGQGGWGNWGADHNGSPTGDPGTPPADALQQVATRLSIGWPELGKIASQLASAAVPPQQQAAQPLKLPDLGQLFS
jgi:hypothetical protein